MKATVVGILGAGRAGTAFARLAVRAGASVLIANSQGPESLSLTIEVLTPGATAATSVDLATRSDIIVLALPLSRYRGIPAEPLRGKIVIDAMNYWAYGEGVVAEFQSAPQRSSEKIQTFLPGARLVKTLNHVGYHELEESALPEGAPGRLALGVAGDEADAKSTVARLLNDLGFDSLDIGPLAEGWRLAPGSSVFGGRLTREELRAALNEPGASVHYS